MCLFGGNPTYWKHVSLVYSAVEHPAWWQMINFDVKFNFKNYVLGPENLWLCCPANQKCMIWSYDCGARVDMSTLTPGREAGSRGSVKWVRCGVWDEHWGQIDSDLTVVWGPSIAGIHSLVPTYSPSKKKLGLIDKLLLEHVGLPHVLDLAVHLVNFLCWMSQGDNSEPLLLWALFYW